MYLAIAVASRLLTEVRSEFWEIGNGAGQSERSRPYSLDRMTGAERQSVLFIPVGSCSGSIQCSQIKISINLHKIYMKLLHNHRLGKPDATKVPYMFRCRRGGFSPCVTADLIIVVLTRRAQMSGAMCYRPARQGYPVRRTTQDTERPYGMPTPILERFD